MKRIYTLNLLSPEESNLKFHIINYPDGQQDIVIVDDPSKKRIRIVSYLNNFRHLELICAANSALKRLGRKKIELYIPYLLGARSDRQTQDGGSSYLVDVLAPIINQQGFAEVRAVDAHQPDVAAACIKNFVSDYPAQLFFDVTEKEEEDFAILCPDSGAQKRALEAAKLLEKPIITCSKVREPKTGKILKTVVPEVSLSERYIIIDDICDGGRTFIEIAKAVRERQPKATFTLAVTHGIFSAGFADLSNYFDKIYTTNSLPRREDLPSLVHVTDII